MIQNHFSLMREKQRRNSIILQKASLVSINLVILDFLCCLIAALSLYYDTALPALTTDQDLHIYALSTNLYNWTLFRNVVFWFSAALRIMGILEVGARIFAFYKFMTYGTFSDAINEDPVEIIDPILAVIFLATRFFLPLRISLLFNNLVALRLIRIYKYLNAETQLQNADFKQQLVESERDFMELLRSVKQEKEDVEKERDQYLRTLRESFGEDFTVYHEREKSSQVTSGN